MSLLYYSRMRFILNLLLLLRDSTFLARIISIYAAGVEKTADWNPNDFSLRQLGHYGFIASRAHNVIAITLFIKRLAKQNAGKLSLTRVFPCLVITPVFSDEVLLVWFKVMWFLLGPIAGLFAVSAEAIGERTLFFTLSRYPPRDCSDFGVIDDVEDLKVPTAMSTDDVLVGGAYSCKYDGESCAIDPGYENLREKNAGDVVWKHTIAVFGTIEASKVFYD